MNTKQKNDKIEFRNFNTGKNTHLKIMTAMFEFSWKSRIISSAIFLAFPYGLIGSCIYATVGYIFFNSSLKLHERKSLWHGNYVLPSTVKSQTRKPDMHKQLYNLHLWCFFCNWHLFRLSICCTCTRIYQCLHTMCCHCL